jgi:hypothetical protein
LSQKAAFLCDTAKSPHDEEFGKTGFSGKRDRRINGPGGSLKCNDFSIDNRQKVVTL